MPDRAREARWLRQRQARFTVPSRRLGNPWECVRRRPGRVYRSNSDRKNQPRWHCPRASSCAAMSWGSKRRRAAMPIKCCHAFVVPRRGGAGYPTGLKWATVAQSPGKNKYVICNADEGDPGAFMDRSVLESDPPSPIVAACPLPAQDPPRVLLGHGGGGRLTRELVERMMLPAFANPHLEQSHDSAVIETTSPRLAFTSWRPGRACNLKVRLKATAPPWSSRSWRCSGRELTSIVCTT